MKRWFARLAYIALMVPAAALPAVSFGADWVDYATVSMTDPVTPKLTARYTCYTDGTDIACNSPSIYVSSGGLIGINTANPNAQLEVNGVISGTTVSATTMNGHYASFTALSVNGSSIGAVSAASSTGAIQFNSGNSFAGDTTNLFWDDANNRLGIGISNPSTTLHMAGDGVFTFDGVAGNPTLRARYIGTSLAAPTSPLTGTVLMQLAAQGYNATTGFGNRATINMRASQDWNATQQGTYTTFGTTTSGTVSIVERMRITELGNIGVANTNPLAKLDVTGTISASDIIQVGSTTTIACGSSVVGSIRYTNVSDTLQICTGSGWKSLVSGTSGLGNASVAGGTGDIQFNTAGSMDADTGEFYWDKAKNWLGIGTGTVGDALTVVGSISATGNVSATAYYSGDGNAYFYNNGSIPSLVFDTNDYFRFTRSTNTLDWLIGGSPKVTIDSAGKVGIVGNSDPQAALDATGGIVSATTYYGSNGTVSVPTYSFSNDSNMGLYRAAADVLGVSVGAANVVSISADGIGATGLTVAGHVTATGVVSASGYVIGGATPNALGGVRYNSVSDTLQIYTSTGWKSLVSGTAGNAVTASSTGAIQFNSNNTLGADTDNLFWNDATNRLGIGGIRTPSATLDVVGTVSVSLGLSTTNVSVRNAVRFLGLAGGAPVGLAGSGDAITSGTTNVTTYEDTSITFTTAGSTRMTLTTAGNLGLGTTTPRGLLELYSTAAPYGLFIDAGPSGNPIAVFGRSSGASATVVIHASGGDPQLQFNRSSVAEFTLGDDNGVFKLAGSGAVGTSDLLAITSAGLVSASSGYLGAAGSAGAPTYSWVGDSDNGMYRIMPDTVGFAAGGAERMRVSPGYVSTSVPIAVSGSSGMFAAYDRTQGVGRAAFYRNATISRLWDDTAGDVITYNTSGQVGIGNTAPGAKLGVSGHARLMGATSNTLGWAAVGAAAPGTGSDGMKLQLYPYGSANVMNASDYALGVESNNMWFNTNTGYKFYEDSILRAEIQTGGIISATSHRATDGDTATAPGFAWGTDTNTGMYHPAADTIGFSTNGTERARLYGGYFGLNLNGSNPSYALHVSGATVYQQNTSSAYSYITAHVGGSTAASNSSAGILVYPGAAGTTEHRLFTEASGGDSYWRWLAYSDAYASTTYRGDMAILRYLNGAGTWLMRFDGATGYISVGMSTVPAYRLDLPNTASVAGRGRANAWSTYSDGRYKTDVKEIGNALDKVSHMRGVTYRSTTEKNPVEQVGFIAQEVEKVLPQVVYIASTTVEYANISKTDVVPDYRSLDYPRITALLVEATKELNTKLEAENKALRDEVDELKKNNAMMAEDMAEIKAMLAKDGGR